MNYAMIRFVIGKVLKMEGLLLILPSIVGLLYREKSTLAFLVSILLCFGAGFLLSFRKPDNNEFYALEGLVIVALSWVALSIFGSLPFLISGEIPSVANALFETASGFTTTGSSILEDVEAMSHCMIFWRSFTHWIGGMGVLVFMLAILPSNGGSNMYLMKAESPGPSIEKLVPRLQNTAIILYGIYTVMTIIQIVLLLIGKMPLFDALTITFGTAGTGGFGIKNDSMAGYSPYLQNTVTIFMILFGVNFNIYYLFLVRKWKSVIRSEELRAYLGFILVGIAIVTVYIFKSYDSFGTALRHAAFQVGSIITTTGYATTDFNEWHQVPKMVLILLMFSGACAGSTAGGIKVSRVVIAIKTVKKEIFNFIHPHGIRKVKLDGHLIEHNTIRNINIFLIGYFLIFFLSIFLVSVDNHSFVSNFSAVLTALSNVGPGLDMVGPLGNFNGFSDFSKYVLIFDMLAGRLEIFPILLLFSPHTWRRGVAS